MFDFDRVPDRHGTNSVKWDIQKYRFGVEGLLPFWIADMDFPVAPCITAAMQTRLVHPVYGYTAPSLSYKKGLCGWLERRHGWSVQPDWLVPAQNTVTALTVALTSVTAPGDGVLVLTPAYDPFFTAVTATGRTLITLPLTENNARYELDFDTFEQTLRQGVRALLFCNPHNPGGKVWTAAELERIAALCARWNVTILSDDVHCDWAFAPSIYTPIAAFPDAATRTVVFTAPSKTFNLAGLSACTLVIPDDILRRTVEKGLAGMFIKGPNLFALAAMEAAYNEEEAAAWLDDAKAYVAQNAAEAAAFLASRTPRLHLFNPEGTFMLWLDCRALTQDSGALCRTLAQNYGISLNDGTPYGEGGQGFVRINIACPRTTLRIGLEALAAWYQDQESEREG